MSNKIKESIIVLNSVDATYTSDYDFNFNLSNNITNGVNIQIVDIAIPWSWYTKAFFLKNDTSSPRITYTCIFIANHCKSCHLNLSLM